MRTQPSALERLRANRDLLLCILILAIVISGIAGPTIALHRNVLNAHPQWSSTKTRLEKGVMGALAFVSLQQGLAGNRLNLGAWFGYQEVLYQEAVELSALSLSFLLEEDGYVHVLYGYGESGFSGLRFSNRPEFPDIHYTAAPSGEFLDVRELKLAQAVSALDRHDVRLEFGPDSTTVLLDGETVGRFAPVIGSQRIGLRGSQRNTWIDDVVLTRIDGSTIHEDFSNHGVALPAAAAILAILMVAAAIVVVIAPRRPSASRRAGLWVAMAYMVLIFVCAAAYVSQRISARDYPSLSGSTLEAENYWIDSSYGSILEDIQDAYAGDAAPTDRRVLFVGGSQTWGAGALARSDAWVLRTEQLLNSDGGEIRYVCINGGVPGFTARQVLEFLRDDLLELRPRAAVINIGNNDTDPAELGDSFEAILDLLQEHGVRTILILEANSIEKRLSDSRHGDLRIKHRVLTELAEARDVSVIDMHEHLTGLRNAGFVWWDFSHLTSFGQRLVAEHLHDRLPGVLGFQ
jgi:lysophospholipase L1-like esterase